jgi:hypothetical protein
MPRVRALDTLDRRVVIPANAGISGANLNEHRVRLTRKILGQAQDDGEAVPTGSRGGSWGKTRTTVTIPTGSRGRSRGKTRTTVKPSRPAHVEDPGPSPGRR